MDFEPGRNENEGSLCDCRPGFGRRSNLQNATCESKCILFLYSRYKIFRIASLLVLGVRGVL